MKYRYVLFVSKTITDTLHNVKQRCINIIIDMDILSVLFYP